MSTPSISNDLTGGNWIVPKTEEYLREQARCAIARRAASREDYDELVDMLDLRS